MATDAYAQGVIPRETLRRIQRHPLFTSATTQREFIALLIEEGLSSPRFAVAEMADRLRTMENDLENLRSRDKELSDAYRNLEAQREQLAQTLATDTEAERDTLQPAAALNGDVPEGHFKAVIESAIKADYGSRVYVDLHVRIADGPLAGHSFIDRVLAVPAGERAARFKAAVGLGPDDLLHHKVEQITGTGVLVRRVKGSAPDGSPRMLCYYHRLPIASA